MKGVEGGNMCVSACVHVSMCVSVCVSVCVQYLLIIHFPQHPGFG